MSNKKPKLALVSKKERLKGMGAAALTTVAPDEALRKDEATLRRTLDLCDSKVRALAELPVGEVDPNALYKLANAQTGLLRATLESRRFELESGGAIILAEERIKAELKQLLASEPELVARVHELAAQARSNVESQPLITEG